MTQQDDIRKAFFEEGLNVSEISVKFNMDRKTVRKYISKTDWNKQGKTSTRTGRKNPNS